MPMILAITAAAAATLTDAPSVALNAPLVRIGDVAVPGNLPRAEWERLAPMVIARVPDGRAVTLSRTAIATLITRRAPSLRLASGAKASGVRFVVRSTAPNGSTLGCRVLAAAHETGSVVSANDTRPAPCTDAMPAHLDLDRANRRLTAPRALAAGAYLGRIVPYEAAPVASGSPLRLISRVGPVAIERTVTALQLGRSGQKVFVRDPDGQVFAARLDTEGHVQ